MVEAEIDVAELSKEAHDMNALAQVDAAIIAPPENNAFQKFKKMVKDIFEEAGVIGKPQNEAIENIEKKHLESM